MNRFYDKSETILYKRNYTEQGRTGKDQHLPKDGLIQYQSIIFKCLYKWWEKLVPTSNVRKTVALKTINVRLLL